MSTTQPIRDYSEVRKIKKCLLEGGEYRDYMLVSVCLNTALRICDVISLKWSDIFDGNKKLKKHIRITEQKTGKTAVVCINKSLQKDIALYVKNAGISNTYLFASKKGGHISRYRAFQIIKSAGIKAGLPYDISCHSLRKTFGYHAWKNGIPPAVFMNIYNHSSIEITKRYLGITQDDRDSVYNKVEF